MEELKQALHSVFVAIGKLLEPIARAAQAAWHALVPKLKYWWKIYRPRQSKQTQAFLKVRQAQFCVAPHAHKRKIHRRQRMCA